MVVNSELVIVMTNVFVPEDGSLTMLGSDLEFDTVIVRLVSVSSTDLVNEPGLVLTVVAAPVNNVLSVVIATMPYIKTTSSIVSNVSSRSVEPSNLIRVSSLVCSHGNSPAVLIHTDLDSVSENLVSSLPGSQGVGSLIKHPPLSRITWVVVLDSDSELSVAVSFSP